MDAQYVRGLPGGMGRRGTAPSRDRARPAGAMKPMRRGMRPMASAIAAVFLSTHVGLAEAGQDAEKRAQTQAMSSSEDARLAARAARTPHLENFTAGQGTGGGEVVLLAFLFALMVAVGHLIACPLGWTHSTQGKTFVPADSLSGNSKTVNFFNICGAILGFPLYALGYLIGLPFAPDRPPAKWTPGRPEPFPIPPGDLGRRLETFLLGYTIEEPAGPDEGVLLRILALSNAAENAGLERGDLILEFDGDAVTNANFADVIARYQWGDTVDVGVLRGGCRLRMAVVLPK